MELGERRRRASPSSDIYCVERGHSNLLREGSDHRLLYRRTSHRLGSLTVAKGRPARLRPVRGRSSRAPPRCRLPSFGPRAKANTYPVAAAPLSQADYPVSHDT